MQVSGHTPDPEDAHLCGSPCSFNFQAHLNHTLDTSVIYSYAVAPLEKNGKTRALNTNRSNAKMRRYQPFRSHDTQFLLEGWLTGWKTRMIRAYFISLQLLWIGRNSTVEKLNTISTENISFTAHKPPRFYRLHLFLLLSLSYMYCNCEMNSRGKQEIKEDKTSMTPNQAKEQWQCLVLFGEFKVWRSHRECLIWLSPWERRVGILLYIIWMWKMRAKRAVTYWNSQ